MKANLSIRMCGLRSKPGHESCHWKKNVYIGAETGYPIPKSLRSWEVSLLKGEQGTVVDNTYYWTVDVGYIKIQLFLTAGLILGHYGKNTITKITQRHTNSDVYSHPGNWLNALLSIHTTSPFSIWLIHAARRNSSTSQWPGIYLVRGQRSLNFELFKHTGNSNLAEEFKDPYLYIKAEQKNPTWRRRRRRL